MRLSHLNTSSSPVHPPGTQQRDLPEADALAQGDEDDAVPRAAHHLDGTRGDDEHLHPDVSLLADVVAGQEDDRLQLAHNRLVKKIG